VIGLSNPRARRQQHPRPLAPGLSRRPCSAAHGPGPSVFPLRAKKADTARGKASASLAKQLERLARSGLSHIAMDTGDVIGRWCGARFGSGLAYASRGQTLFDGGAGFAGLRGRPSPSPAGRSGPSPAEGPRRFRQCRSGPAGAFPRRFARVGDQVFGLKRSSVNGPSGGEKRQRPPCPPLSASRGRGRAARGNGGE